MNTSYQCLTRVYTPLPLTEGVVVPLETRTVQHICQVLRLAPGDQLRLFHPNSGEFEATLTEVRRQQALCVVGTCLLGPSIEDGPELVFPPLKPKAMGFLVQKAVELGVRSLTPVSTQRSRPQTWRRDKVLMQAIDAAEQSWRLSIPRVAELVSLPTWLAHAPRDRVIIVGFEAGLAPPLLEVLNDLVKNPPLGDTSNEAGQLALRLSQISLVVGPEGGFSPAENAALQERGRTSTTFRCVSLGPRILRSETAACLLLGLCQAVLGDLERGLNHHLESRTENHSGTPNLETS